MATPIDSPRALLAHGLRSILWVEERLDAEVLPALHRLVRSTDLRWALERHMHETKGHMRNLRRVLTILEEPADPVESPALVGLAQEHDAVLAQLDAGREDVLDIFHADVIARAEQLEIAAYTGLVHLAKALAVPFEAVTLLRENMEQEAHALEQVEHALVKLLAEQVESAV